MKNSWKRIKWGDICTLVYGKSLTNYKNRQGKFRVYGTNGPIGYTDEYLSDRPGVIIGRKGAYRGVHYSPQPFFVIDTAFYIEPKEIDFDIKYAYYQLLTQDINGLDSGSAIPSTSRDDFYNLSVYLPPLSEQRAIAEILSALDDKIELNLQMNKLLEEMANALYKHWFVDFGPFKHERFIESELGPIPNSLSVQSLDSVAEFLNGLALQKFPPSGKSDLPVIKIKEMRSGITKATDYANNSVPSRYVLKNGDLLFSWSGTLDVSIWCRGSGALNQHLFKVTPYTLPQGLIYLYLKDHLSNFQKIAANKATTMGHIQRSHLNEAKVLVPNSETALTITKQFQPLFDLMVQNLVEAENVGSTRDYLLPKLISGEIRVREAEKRMKELV